MIMASSRGLLPIAPSPHFFNFRTVVATVALQYRTVSAYRYCTALVQYDYRVPQASQHGPCTHSTFMLPDNMVREYNSDYVILLSVPYMTVLYSIRYKSDRGQGGQV